jgi:hypothetical protein
MLLGVSGGGMAADTALKTELFEEALHPGEVLTLVRIYLVQFPCYLKKIPCSGKIIRC